MTLRHRPSPHAPDATRLFPQSKMNTPGQFPLTESRRRPILHLMHGVRASGRWLLAGILLLAGAFVALAPKSPRLTPAVSGYRLTDKWLVIDVSLSNTSRHPLWFSHHPFPVRCLYPNGWTNAEIATASRSGILDPGDVLALQLLIAHTEHKPKRFRVGLDFETRQVSVLGSALRRLPPFFGPARNLFQENARLIPPSWSQEFTISP